MKLGPRVAVFTTLLMAAVLAAATGAVLVVLHADQLREMDREAHSLAEALATGMEPLPREKAGEALKARVTAQVSKGGSFRLEAVAWGAQRPNNSWAGLVEEATNRLHEAEAEGGAQLDNARAYMEEKARYAKDKAKEVGQRTHEYAKENPWQVAGFAAAVGVILGLLISRGKDRD